MLARRASRPCWIPCDEEVFALSDVTAGARLACRVASEVDEPSRLF